jgi:hypothetical protein
VRKVGKVRKSEENWGNWVCYMLWDVNILFIHKIELHVVL